MRRATRGKIYSRGKYRFTPARRQALRRAQLKGARGRKGKKLAIGAGVMAGVTTIGVLGYKNRTAIARTVGGWKNAAQPDNKEATRAASAISTAHPSHTTVITPGARQAAQATRDALEKAALPPHMGGPDNRIYNEDDSVNTEAMTEKGVKRTVNNARRRTQGNKTGSLTGTPGGTLTTPKATGDPLHGGLTEQQWKDALAMELQARQPLAPQGAGGSKKRTHDAAFSSAESQASYADAYAQSIANAARIRAAAQGEKVVSLAEIKARTRKSTAGRLANKRGKDAKPKVPTNGSSTKDSKPTVSLSEGDMKAAIDAIVNVNPGISREQAAAAIRKTLAKKNG